MPKGKKPQSSVHTQMKKGRIRTYEARGNRPNNSTAQTSARAIATSDQRLMEYAAHNPGIPLNWSADEIDNLGGFDGLNFDDTDWEEEEEFEVRETVLGGAQKRGANVPRYWRRYRDWRTAGYRAKVKRMQWRNAVPALAKAYVLKRSGHGESAELPGSSEGVSYTVLLVDVHTRSVQQIWPGLVPLPTFLIQLGFLGATSERPKVAFSLKLMELFVELQTTAHTTPYAFVQTIAKLSRTSYKAYHYDLFQASVSAFRAIQRWIREEAAKSVGRLADPIHSRCPACQYHVKGEIKQEYSIILAVDGNESQKRFKSRNNQEQERFPSEFILSLEKVADAALDSPKGRKPNRDDCTANWTAADQTEARHAKECFDETGIVATCCPHGPVFAAADMIQSGELAKYAIAVTRRACEGVAGNGKVLMEYDIGCEHGKTWRTAEAALEERTGEKSRLEVQHCCPSWHGYAHNRLCQLQHHPLHIKKVGKVEGEINERLWSILNKCAMSTRHASKFKRGERIDSQLLSWNEAKVANLGIWIKNRIKLMNTCVSEYQPTVRAAMAKRTETREQLREYVLSLCKEEEEYLIGRKGPEVVAERDQVVLEGEYLLVLEMEKMTIANKATLEAKGGAHIGPAWIGLRRRMANIENDRSVLEKKLNLAAPWVLGDDNCAEAGIRLQRYKFDEASRALQRLVVSRLLELEKVGLAHTGYSLRMALRKSIKTRSKAIQASLKVYNDLGARCGQKKLAWEEVLNYTYLSEFALSSLNTVENKPDWADPRMRDIIRASLHLDRAEEEGDRLELEIQRVAAFCRDELMFWEGQRKCSEAEGTALLDKALIIFASSRVLFWIQTLQRDVYAAALNLGTAVDRKAERAEYVAGWELMEAREDYTPMPDEPIHEVVGEDDDEEVEADEDAHLPGGGDEEDEMGANLMMMLARPDDEGGPFVGGND
ncbi:hypothetical protein P7C70_g6348, partial [Phenoliferia sp. Uapishka_3]